MTLSGNVSPSQRGQSARFPRGPAVTSDSRPDEAGGIQARSSAPTQPTARTHSVASNGGRPTTNTAPADNSAITTGEGSGTLVLRSGTPPVDQLDFDDRHDTRATESDELAQRYGDLRKNRRRDDWHKLAMSLVGFAVLAVTYLSRLHRGVATASASGSVVGRQNRRTGLRRSGRRSSRPVGRAGTQTPNCSPAGPRFYVDLDH